MATPSQTDSMQLLPPELTDQEMDLENQRRLRAAHRYGTDMPTGQPYGTDVSPYASVSPKVAPQPQQVRSPRPEQRPGSPSPQSVPTGADGSKLGAVPEDQAGADPLSPTTMIYNYLREKGVPLTSENVRRVLEGNAQNPGMISGTGRDDAYSNAEMPIHLVNDVAGTDPKVSAAPRRLPMPPTPPAMSGEEYGPAKPPVEEPKTGFMSNATDLARWILGRGNPPAPATPNLQLELRNPTQPKQITGPGEGGGGGGRGVAPSTPQLPPPSPEGVRALPAPEPRVTLPTPTIPQAPAPAPVPAVPAVPRTPSVTVNQLPTEQPRAPAISPQNPVVQGPGAKTVGNVARSVGNVGAGVVGGYTRGGARGAAIGGGTAIAQEVIPPLVEALLKGAAKRKPPTPRPRKKVTAD